MYTEKTPKNYKQNSSWQNNEILGAIKPERKPYTKTRNSFSELNICLGMSCIS